MSLKDTLDALESEEEKTPKDIDNKKKEDKKMKIQPPLKHLKEGDPITHVLRISKVELKPTKKNPYLVFVVGDKETEFKGKKWDSTENDLKKWRESKVAFITGKVSSYQGNLEITADSIAMPGDDVSEEDIKDLFPPEAPAVVWEPGKQILIKNIKEKDLPVVGVFRVAGADLKTSKKNTQYLQLKLADKTGEIVAKKWDCNQADLDKVKGAKAVFIVGKSDDFNGPISVVFESLEVKEVTEEEYRNLFVSTKYDPIKLKKGVWEFIQAIKNPFLKKLGELTLKNPDTTEVAAKFGTAVAAVSMHHNYRHGLLTHVYRLMQISDKLVDAFNDNPYPDSRYRINKDIIITLCLFHDLFKIEEYNEDGSYSDYGALVPHLPKGAIYVEYLVTKYMPDFPEELKRQIQHGLLSHHGEEKFGSPVTPKTVEAQLFHHIDFFAAKIDPMLESLDALDTNIFWTEPLKALGSEQVRAKPAYMGGMRLKELGYPEGFVPIWKKEDDRATYERLKKKFEESDSITLDSPKSKDEK